MIQIEMAEAASKLPALVQQAQAGEQVVLLERGTAVARVTAEARAISCEDRARALKAIEDIRELAAKLDLGPFDFEQFKADRDLGRR
jgi:antitoxin (DNA-binding transcriptional repressor) of toxin-antitoxin stability system